MTEMSAVCWSICDMGKYFCLQCKRFFRLLPWAFLAASLLLTAIGGAYILTVQKNENPENNKKITIALCGSTEGNFLELGLQALEAFDNTRFSMTFLQMTEAEAAQALDDGEVSAYIVIPEGFIEGAFRGDILPLEMVTSPDAPGIISIFREEVAQTVTVLLLDAQRGVFGMMDSFSDFPAEGQQNLINTLALQYAQLVFARNDTYTPRILEASGQYTLLQNLLGGFGVLFLLLICLPFVPLLIRQNESFRQMLRGKGYPGFSVAFVDFSVFFLSLSMLLTILCLGAAAVVPDAAVLFSRNVIALLSVIVAVAAFSFLLGSLCCDLISGLLTQFFVTAAMGFVCGCIYPVSFFPDSLQKLAALLPVGVARTALTTWLTGNSAGSSHLWLWVYSAGFVLVGCTLRSRMPGRNRR